MSLMKSFEQLLPRLNLNKNHRWIFWLLALLPTLFSVAAVYHYGLDIVRYDELGSVTILAQLQDGTLTPSFLMKQANESRPAFPRLITVALVLLMGWKTRIEMFFSQGLVLANLLLIVCIARKVAGEARAVVGPSVMFLMGLALFSLWQVEFLWGFQMLVHIPMTCILAAMALAHTRLSLIGVTMIGASLCFVSTYSYANGLLAWPLVGLYIAYTRMEEIRMAWWKMGFFVLSSLGTTILYFTDYVKPPHHPKFSLTHSEFVSALLVFFGAPLGALRFDQVGLVMSAIWGLALLLILFGILYYTMWRRALHNLLPLYAPIIVIAAYVVISGIIATAGRIVMCGGLGILQATRYAGFSTYLIATLILAVALLRHPTVKALQNGAALRGFSYFFALLAGAFVLSVLWQNLIAVTVTYPQVHRGLSQMRAGLAVVDYVDVPELESWVFPKLLPLKAYMSEGRRIGVLPRSLKPEDFVKPSGPPVGCIDAFVKDGNAVVANGWAYLPTGRPPDGIVITSTAKNDGNAKILGVLFPSVLRPDLKEAIGAKDILAGWHCRLAMDGTETMQYHFWAVDGSTLEVYCIGSR
jgi:hypothetical protein